MAKVQPPPSTPASENASRPQSSRHKSQIGIVEDEKATLHDLEEACGDRYEVRSWHNYQDARTDLLVEKSFKPDLLLVDCCLRTLDQGETTEGVQLAASICHERSLKGTSIFMYTKFALAPAVRQELESLLSRYKATDSQDVLNERRVINKDLDGCVKDLVAEELLSTALARRKSLGLPPL